jgi:ribosome biogenesis protein ERB1
MDLERDELDEFLRRQNDPNWWRELSDKLNNKNVKLSKEDIELIERIRSGRLPYAEDEEDNEMFIPPINDDDPELQFAMSDYNPKRRFVRSLNERKMVNRYLQAIRRGWLRVRTRDEILKEYKDRYEKTWDIWKDDSITGYRPRRLPKQIDAPKKDPPTHAESYNPSKEYLLTEKEKQHELEIEPEERMYNFTPEAIESLRKVPLYENLIKETFER